MQGRRPLANNLIKTFWNQHLHKNRAGNPLAFPSFRPMLATGKKLVRHWLLATRRRIL